MRACGTAATTRESASFLRLLSTVRFSFVRSPTATTIRASSRGWTTTRASCCAAPTPSARGAGSTSRPTPGRATSSSRRSSPGGGSAPTTRGTTPRPSSRVSGIRIRWHREREAGRRKWRKGVKCRHCKQMRYSVSSTVLSNVDVIQCSKGRFETKVNKRLDKRATHPFH